MDIAISKFKTTDFQRNKKIIAKEICTSHYETIWELRGQFQNETYHQRKMDEKVCVPFASKEGKEYCKSAMEGKYFESF
jgi:hypothetical protein